MALGDRGALEALFRSTGGENWTNRTNWASDAELSTWHGVIVDANDRVKEFWEVATKGSVDRRKTGLVQIFWGGKLAYSPQERDHVWIRRI